MSALRFSKPAPTPELAAVDRVLLAEILAELQRVTARLAAIEALGPRTLPQMMSVRQVADVLGISVSKCYELCDQGVIPSRKIGSAVRISRAWLLAFIEGTK